MVTSCGYVQPKCSNTILGGMCIITTNLDLVMPVVLEALEWQNIGLKDRLESSYKIFCSAYSPSLEAVRVRMYGSHFYNHLNVMQAVQLYPDKG